MVKGLSRLWEVKERGKGSASTTTLVPREGKGREPKDSPAHVVSKLREYEKEEKYDLVSEG